MEVIFVLAIVWLVGLYCFGIYAVGRFLYWCADHGTWSENANPTRMAEVTCFSVKRVSLGGEKYKSRVSFSDGYQFETVKTKVEQNYRVRKISMDEELHRKILGIAVLAHEKAVEKYEKKGSLPKKRFRYSQRKDARQKNRNFEMTIDEIAVIPNKGTFLLGKIKSGMIRPEDLIFIRYKTYRLRGIEKPGSVWNEARSGDEVGLLIEISPEAMTIVAGDIVKAE